MVPKTLVRESDIRALASAFRLSGWGLLPSVRARGPSACGAVPPRISPRAVGGAGGAEAAILCARAGLSGGSWCQAASTSRRLTWDQVPLMVVENGLGAFDELVEEAGMRRVHDTYRIDYLRQHVHAMEAAINNGVDLWGYTPWGCVDLVSMGTGEMRKRYGFVYVDMDDEGKGTLDRYRKDSFWWYQRCIASNGTNV